MLDVTETSWEQKNTYGMYWCIASAIVRSAHKLACKLLVR